MWTIHCLFTAKLHETKCERAITKSPQLEGQSEPSIKLTFYNYCCDAVFFSSMRKINYFQKRNKKSNFKSNSIDVVFVRKDSPSILCVKEIAEISCIFELCVEQFTLLWISVERSFCHSYEDYNLWIVFVCTFEFSHNFIENALIDVVIIYHWASIQLKNTRLADLQSANRIGNNRAKREKVTKTHFFSINKNVIERRFIGR